MKYKNPLCLLAFFDNLNYSNENYVATETFIITQCVKLCLQTDAVTFFLLTVIIN